MAYLLEVDNYFNQIHVDFRLKDKREIVINDLKEKNYEHERRFSWKYMCKHDYFYIFFFNIRNLNKLQLFHYFTSMLSTMINSPHE